jgi:thiamine biosynthesis protein ThiS
MDVLKINGSDRKFAAGEFPSTLADLLTILGVDAATVVAELDGDIVERVKFGNTKLRSGQRLELVRFVPGG